MLQYCVLSPTGFQMRGATTALYPSQKRAMEAAGPGDQILPVYDSVTRFRKPYKNRKPPVSR